MARQKVRLRTAVVGCGGIGRTHIKGILKNRHADLAAVCDVDEVAARETARRFHIGKYYTDLSELLRREHIDLVHITAPPRTHVALSTQAMQAGCHVLVEKPFALTLHDADIMLESARENGVRLCPVHDQLFFPVVVKARSLIDGDSIGDPIRATITVNEPENGSLVANREHWCHKLPGGTFGEMLPHPLYLASAFLGKLQVAAVFWRKFSSYEWLIADELRAVLEGKNSIATIAASLRGRHDAFTIDIVGTKGALHISIAHGVVIRHATPGRDRFSHGMEAIRTSLQWFTCTASAAVAIASRRYHTGHRELIDGFVDSVRLNTDMPVAPEDAREVVRLYEAILGQVDVTA